MNAKKIMFLALLSSVLTVASANLPIPPVKSGAHARDVIREQIALALNDLDAANNQEVLVFFKVGAAKEFVLIKVEGENSELVQKVNDELRRELIRVPMVLNGSFYLKVRFVKDGTRNEIFKPEDLLRRQLADTLATVGTSETGRVNLLFFIDNNSFCLKKVEGSNSHLVSAVEASLKNKGIVPPSGLAGNYKVSVRF